MAHVWTADSREDTPEWTVHPLEGEGYELTVAGKIVPLTPAAQRCTRASVVLVRHAPADAWALLVHPDTAVRVNGQPAPMGIHVLHDKDEIRIGGQKLAPMYYSTERFARVEAFPGAERAVHCPRCKTELKAGSPAVCCPNPRCGLWHHQAPDANLPCWTYDARCASCDQPTALDTGYRWTPEGL